MKSANASRCCKHVRHPWTFCSDEMFVVQVLIRGCQNIQISCCMQEEDQGRAKLGRRSYIYIYIYIYVCNISTYNQGSRARALRKPRFTHGGPMPFCNLYTVLDMDWCIHKLIWTVWHPQNRSRMSTKLIRGPVLLISLICVSVNT